MTLEFFYNNYDLKNMEIRSVEILDNKLIIDTNVTAYLELIANGYRPELDVNHEIVFIFDYEGKNKKYKNHIVNNIFFKDDCLYINVDGDDLKITNNNVLVKKKS